MRLHWIAILTVTLAACGDSDEPPTHAEFVARADAVCKEHNEKLYEALADLDARGAPLPEEEVNQWLEGYAGLYEDMADDLSDLDRPENDAAIERYLDRLRRNAEGFKNGPGVGEDRFYDFNSAASNSIREANTLAEELGLKVCSPIDQL